jgi:hypothetical protein
MTFAAGCFVRLHTTGTTPREPFLLSLLCPRESDNNFSIRQAIRTHHIILETEDFPCFLWEGEVADLSNLKRGFLRGEILLRVCDFTPLTHLTLTSLADCLMHLTRALCRIEGRRFWGRWLCGQIQHVYHLCSRHRLRCHHRESPSGADLELNLRLIPKQARHALTSDGTFSWTESGSRFSYIKFYSAIVASVSKWPEGERKQLIQWWNG